MSRENLTELLARVKDSLSEFGVLLHSDSRLPSLVGIVVGAPIRGSWWGHPKAHLIFQVAGMLSRDSDVMVAKLVSGKETYVHRVMWSDLLAIATAMEPWQLKSLLPTASLLLEEVRLRGEIRTHEFALQVGIDGKSMGDAARQLERRLLVYGEGFHTESGFHAKLLRSWDVWMTSAGFQPTSVGVTDARRNFENRIKGINLMFHARGRLPWA